MKELVFFEGSGRQILVDWISKIITNGKNPLNK
jgi:hypothetical protein